MKKKGKHGILLAILCIISLSIEGHAQSLDLHATYCSVMDSETGRVLYDVQGDEAVPMASTTKILTAILILEESGLDEYARASKLAEQTPKVRMGAKEGECYRIVDLLYGLLLESYNDAAVILAEHHSGSVERFALRLNEKAKEIGCENYHFVTPNGLDAEDEGGAHRISANDLSKVMSYCTTKSSMKEAFVEITRTKTYIFPAYQRKDNDMQKTEKIISCENKNVMLENESILSGKTGYTNDAGYCYVCQARVNEGEVSIALLACGWPNKKTYKWQDTKSILAYIEENYAMEQITYSGSKHIPETVRLQSATHSIGKSQQTVLKLFADKEENQFFLSDKDNIHFVRSVPTVVGAPVVYGSPLGHVDVYINEEKVDTIQLFAAENVRKNTMNSCVEQVFDNFLTKSLNYSVLPLK